jgi:hypothetical protein
MQNLGRGGAQEPIPPRHLLLHLGCNRPVRLIATTTHFTVPLKIAFNLLRDNEKEGEEYPADGL